MKFKAHKLCKILGKASVKCEELLKTYPPEYSSPRKLAFYEKASFYHRKQKGIVRILRVGFNDIDTKDSIVLSKREISVKVEKEYYKYLDDKSTDEKSVWYVNFADPMLFGYYDGNAFAQDEIQTLEMPLLASCMLYLDGEKIPGMESKTVATISQLRQPGASHIGEKKRKIPTPYLIENVPYWISVNTSPVLENGTVANIYGRAFRSAPEEAISAGIKIIQSDERNNIIAISALEPGKDFYTEEQIRFTLETLISSFSAAVKKSWESKQSKTIVHSGNWGCGAFGGNKELSYLCQIFAASVCGVDELVLHSPDEEILAEAQNQFNKLSSEVTLAEVVKFIKSLNYCWNVSDGN